jgi:hypothetical protein
MQFLWQFHEEGEAFLQQIVTGNETWVHHYEHASKHQRMKWKYISSPRTKKFKSVPSASKVTLTLFWDFNGPIHKHYQDSRQIVNGAQYCVTLEEELKPDICCKHRGMLTRVILHHDNGQPCMTAETREMI